MKLFGRGRIANKICADCAYIGTKPNALTGESRAVCTKVTNVRQDLVTGNIVMWNTGCDVMRITDCGRKGKYCTPKDTPKEDLETMTYKMDDNSW